jgi:ElaB/YqjD/DUF883 family membrane-anchored ribosome-binding protein
MKVSEVKRQKSPPKLKASEPTTSKKALSLDENLKYLRQILSVDTIVDDINQEEGLEFLEAIEDNIATEREDAKDELTELKEKLDGELKEKDEEIEELKHEYDELMKKTDFDLTIETIEYRASGIMDEMIMEALAEAYKFLTPLQILDRLKITSIQKKATA